MAKYKNNAAPSPEVVNESMAIAKGTQRPGQTKEQTKLIAQGIQKGIEQYKKQHKGKSRELDKKLKKVNQRSTTDDSGETPHIDEQSSANSKILPWILLGLSWLGFFVYTLFIK
ncbi:MAG: hypothetical protein ACI9FJ_000110 [Alteromonadaceae bacterium]|jgi:hypothetical protein